VICADSESPPKQVLFEVPNNMDNGKELLPGDTVVSFTRVQKSAGACHNTFHTVLTLDKNGPNPDI